MKTKKNDIRIVAASVVGAQHLHNQVPCQDYYKHVKARNLVATVSDGAGSAKYGKIGARIVCETICDILKNADFKNAQAKIIHAVKVARGKVQRHRFNSQKSSTMNDFAATVVGMVYNKGNGLFFHIGDGAAIAFDDEQCCDFVASRPENGNFACETYFYTQEAWCENLRFTKFNNARSVFLMTDGLTNFSFSNNFNEIERGFIVPIDNFLSAEKTKNKAKRALMNTLNTPRAQKLNADDKTLVWAKVK